jgi:hypothetical protein
MWHNGYFTLRLWFRNLQYGNKRVGLLLFNYLVILRLIEKYTGHNKGVSFSSMPFFRNIFVLINIIVHYTRQAYKPNVGPYGKLSLILSDLSRSLETRQCLL